ncbi:polymeric immunoglobulin receptor-like isoform X1 [Chrysemys picta bellii]|uniref:polymeric immunoglobulin receptor-like isoform X1 n=1 Tax=Chrysemys picta bellii TaxID=8478 RepID=UPI0032B1142E
MGRFSARLLLLALTGPCLAREELELVTAVQGSSFSTTCYYDNDKYSLEEKFWCKMLSDQECNSRLFLTIRAKGGKYLNIAPKRRVDLTNSGTGWISVSMTELRIEDSGTYFCGVYDHQTIILLKKIQLIVSYDAPMRLSAEEGGFISLNCSYFLMDDSRIPNKFTWCKMVTATRCQPVVSIEIDQILNMRERTRIKLDRWNRVIIVTLVALQLRDSGEYHCQTHLQGSTVLLKMITLNVLGKSVYYDTVNETTSPPTNEGETAHPTVASNKEQSLPEAHFSALLCIITVLLVAKFPTAVLIFTIASHQRSRATREGSQNLNQHQHLPITGDLMSVHMTELTPTGRHSTVLGYRSRETRGKRALGN